MKYFEAFGEGGFHSAFMTTYAFGSLAFEDIPFPKLRGAGCRNIVVLADKVMVNQAFAAFGSPRFAGTSYHLVKAEAPGAFHPKITLLIGENKGRLMVGSANLTALGLGGNKEQVASIIYTAEQPQYAKHFVSAVEYLRRYVPQDDPWFEIGLQRALRSAPWLRGIGENAAFESGGADAVNLLLDRPEISLLDQITACIGSDNIERLIVVSPYWDARLEGLASLKSALGNPPVDILIENEANGFPSGQLSKVSDVEVFDISAHAAGRFLHAKLIIAQGTGWDHVISGSMNCTYPALFGPVARGNAEAAIYRRVPRGVAVEALGLIDYRNERLIGEQLDKLAAAFIPTESADGPADGGTLVLQSGRLEWMAPKILRGEPSSLRLLDRDGALVAEFGLDGASVGPWNLELANVRPKYGELSFTNGTLAAPIQITDLDYLAVTTLPPQKGRKRHLIDSLAEALHEDLVLIETLNQLEVLEAEEGALQSPHLPKTARGERNEETRTYEVLPYEDFIRARTIANAHGKVFGTFLSSRQDRAANLISTCLNQMIGLVGVDLKDVEEKDFQVLNSIDFRTTEPGSLEDGDRATNEATRTETRKSGYAQTRATAKKFQEAVSAFEQRCRMKQGQQITTGEMVRLRALMQIILSHAQPISGSFSSSQILPIYTPDGHDWPRLIGRLLVQHFGATRALQNLSVEPDESEQQRVIEYLALANWAANAAHSAISATPRAKSLKAPIEKLLASLNAQTQVILTPLDRDKSYFERIGAQLDERFEGRLALAKKAALQSTARRNPAFG